MFRMGFAATLILHFNKQIIYIAMVAISLTSTIEAIAVSPYNIHTCRSDFELERGRILN